MSSHANDFVNWFSCTTTPICPQEQLVKITATNLASLVLVDLNPGGFVTEGHTKSERPLSPFCRVGDAKGHCQTVFVYNFGTLQMKWNLATSDKGVAS